MLIATHQVTVNIPDCVDPYNMQPIILGWSVFGGLVLIIAVSVLIALWIGTRS